MMEGKRVAGPPVKQEGNPKWRVDLERHKVHAKALGSTAQEQSKDARQLQTEHARFKQALEMIAAGAGSQVALEALGERPSYVELLEENRRLTELVQLMTDAMKAIRDGHLKPEDLPEPDEMPTVESRHIDNGGHPPEES
jgi:hypothetical protein